MIGRRQRKRVVYVDGIPIEATILDAGEPGIKGEERSDPAALAMLDPRALFDKYDTDGSGSIDFDEFKVLLTDLKIALSEPKALAYFRKCDALRRGSISFDEFRLALYTCDPKNPSRTMGFAPGQSLSPKDVFEMFDKDEQGAIDRATFIQVLDFLGKKLPLADMEAIFSANEDPELEVMGYVQFKKVWLSLVDVRAELRGRRERFNRFLPNIALVKKLEALVNLEEQQEATALLEAANSLEDECLARARRELVSEALLLARVVLSEALDAAGQVYLFGKGPFNCFDGDPAQPDFVDFMEYELVQTLWRERVRPDASAVATAAKAASSHTPSEPETDESGFDKAQRTGDAASRGRKHSTSMSSTSKPATHASSRTDATRESRSRIAIDAAARAFASRQVSLMTAFLWGKRVKSVACGSVVAYAVTDTGEVFCWGGKQRAWRYFYDHSTLDAGADDYSVERLVGSHGEQQPFAKDPDRPLTTRSEMLKLTAPAQLAVGQTQYEQLPLRRKYHKTFVKPERLLPTEQERQARLLLVGRYYDLVPDTPAAVLDASSTETPVPKSGLSPAPAPPPELQPTLSLQELMETVEPELNVDDLALSLQMRGVYLAKQTRMELIEKLGSCLALELECVGAKFHAHMKEQDKAARRFRNTRREKPMLDVAARTAARWFDLCALQESILAAERDAFAKSQDEYAAMKRKILAAKQKLKRQAREGYFDASDPLLEVDTGASTLLRANGLTARGSPLQPFNSHQAVECIAVGSRHALAVQQSGKLLAWGVGSFGRLGGAHDAQHSQDSNDPASWHSDVHAPAVVDSLAAHRFRSVACGFGHSLALSSQGRVFVWGSATHGKLGIGGVPVAESFTLAPIPLSLPSGVVVRKIACGPSHSALLTTDGHLFVWGSGDGGKLGLGDARDVGQNLVPRNGGKLGVLSIPTRVVEPFGDEKLVDVSCGVSHTVVLSATTTATASAADSNVVVGGHVYAAGSNHALAKYSPTFTLLSLADRSSREPVAAARVSCGNAHTAVVSTEGELFTWGSNSGGCTGHSVLLPHVKTPTRVSCLYQRPVNLCLLDGVRAMQSTQNASCLPDYALRTTTMLLPSDFAQTQQEMCPFWQVTLLRLSRIERVRVVVVANRVGATRTGDSEDNDSYASATARSVSSAAPRKYTVLVSPFPFDSEERGKYSLALAKGISTHVSFTLHEPRVTEYVWTLPVDTFGQYVRVQLDSTAGMLSLRAVEVVGMDSSEYKGPRVNDVTCGDALTVVICRPLSSVAMLRERFLRAVRADRASLTVLQQIETFHPFLEDELVRRGSVASSATAGCVLCRPKEQCVVCLLEHAILADGKVQAAKRELAGNQSTANAGAAAAQRREQEIARRDTLRQLTLDELCHALLTMSMRTEEEEAAQQKQLEQELQNMNVLAQPSGSESKHRRSPAIASQVAVLSSNGDGSGAQQHGNAPTGKGGILTTLRRVLSRDRAPGTSSKVLAGTPDAAAPVSTTVSPTAPTNTTATRTPVSAPATVLPSARTQKTSVVK